jgi:Tol biopolymer transport system component
VYYARKVLNDISQNRKYEYIENVARSGYRFIAQVEERWVPFNNGTQERVVAPPMVSSVNRTHFRWWAILLGTAAAIGVFTALARPFAPLEARVLKFTQLTNDGKQKSGPLLTDGKVILFQESEGNDRIMTVATSEGEAVPLHDVLPGSAPYDLSADGSLLLFSKTGPNGSQLWTEPLKGGMPRLFAEAWGGSWAPDGKTLTLAGDGVLSIVRPGAPVKRIEVPRKARNPRWSPDGRRIRFEAMGPEEALIWEVFADGSGLHPISQLAAVSKVTRNGVWSPNGQYFFFEAGGRGASNIWVSRGGGMLDGLFNRKAVPLTNGPGSWRFPLAAKHSFTLFAVHEIARPELVFFDDASRTWRPYWGGDAAYELDFSRDAHWVSYVHYPDNTLWKAKADGAEKAQLTTRELEVHQPHWSPDGKQIAFMGRRQSGGPWQVFVVAAGGGAARAPLPTVSDQGVRRGRSTAEASPSEIVLM